MDDAVRRIGELVWQMSDNISNAFTSFIDNTKTAVRNWIDTLVGWIGGLIDKLKKAWDWMNRVGGGGEEPPAPAEGGGDGGGDGGGGIEGEYASGGPVNKTGRYLLHAGEVVMNPQQQARLAQNLVGGGGGGGGGTYHYTVNQTVYSVTGLTDTLNWLKSQAK